MHTSAIPQDEVARLQAGLDRPAIPGLEPLHPRVCVLDMVVLRPTAFRPIVLERLPDVREKVGRARHDSETTVVWPIGQQVKQALDRRETWLERRLVSVRPGSGAVADFGLWQRDRKVTAVCTSARVT